MATLVYWSDVTRHKPVPFHVLYSRESHSPYAFVRSKRIYCEIITLLFLENLQLMRKSCNCVFNMFRVVCGDNAILGRLEVGCRGELLGQSSWILSACKLHLYVMHPRSSPSTHSGADECMVECFCPQKISDSLPSILTL